MAAAGDRRDEVKTIARMLAGRIRPLVQELLPYGREERGEWVALNPTRGDRKPGSFRIHLVGQRAGVWADFATDDAGDALGLVAYLRYAGNLRDAIAWSKAYLGLEEGSVPEAVKREIPPPATDAERSAEEKARRQAALKIFLAAQTSLKGTPAAEYLAGRGIDLAELGRQPRALRFHPELWNRESQAHWPALVAAVSNDSGEHTATHRTWLARRDGRWKKAPLADAKMSLGTVAGSSIRLWRGASGKALKDAPAGDHVAIAEGIETALSVAIACPEIRVLCAVSLSNMANLALPAAIGRVTLCADHDVVDDSPGSRTRRQALARAIAHYRGRGHDVRLALPEAEGLDWNDVLQGVEG
jgi:hypothetical protein